MAKPVLPRQKLVPSDEPWSSAAIFQPSGQRGIADVRFESLLPAFANAFIRRELARIERRRDVGAIRESAAEIAVNAGAEIEPGGGNDHRVDERTLDAVERRRLVAFVDQADRHQAACRRAG